MNTKIINITFNHFHNTISCNIAYHSNIQINENGIVEGCVDLITARDIELRDFLKSLFELDELFKLVKAENDIKKLKRDNLKLARKLEIQK